MTASAPLDSVEYTAESAIPGTEVYDLQNSSAQMNNRAGGGQEPCGPDDESTLAEALRQSCNTSFAMLGVDLGEEQLRETAEGFGFEQRLEIPLSVTPSSLGSDRSEEHTSEL